MLEVPAGPSKSSLIAVSLMWRSREGNARPLFIDAVQKSSPGGGCIGPATRKLCLSHGELSDHCFAQCTLHKLLSAATDDIRLERAQGLSVGL